MKKNLVFPALFAVQCLIFQGSYACTTFFLQKDGQMVFGRNYDWVTGLGTVHTNLRGLAKSSFRMDNGSTVSWVSKYGSTTFNQYGKEFPNGGINETGLVVELMWLNESKYPEADDRAGLNVLQWIQYQLDNCASIQEVINTDKNIRIVSTGTPQHYLVADAKGQAATIEFLNGKMIVHTGNDLPFPVLTNSTYQKSAGSIIRDKALTNTKGGFQDNSIDRFSKACSMIQKYQANHLNKTLVDYSFDILHEVSMDNFTKWSIVYDIGNKKIYFRTSGFPAIKYIDLTKFDYSCSSQPVAFDMNENSKGNVTGKFVYFSADRNKRAIMDAFRESRTHVKVPGSMIESAAVYPVTIKCT